MDFRFDLPTSVGKLEVHVPPGTSAVFVGANGGGKTRLAVRIENTFALNAHRISAHRALTLNPAVPKISEAQALKGLRVGYVKAGADNDLAYREGNRWRNQAATGLLNDFDFLVQALFAEQANMSLDTHRRVRDGYRGDADPTKFERLSEIWDRLLPHRQLHIAGDDIQVSVRGSTARYAASDMSDGERAIFYLIAQCLAAASDSLLVIDEPELHVHRAIMAKLWDELEAARPDCAFVFITHDLEFAASRAAQKFVLREYDPAPSWMIETVPEDTGFDEEITTLILGSRRPILFVEGNRNSLELPIYRCCYPEWTVIPRGSCSEVIHSVVTMRRNQDLTRVTCSGIVDADDSVETDIAYLNRLGVAVLPVSEIENVILLPAVSRAIAQSEGFDGEELEARLAALKEEIFATLANPRAVEGVVARYCQRRIDRMLKKVDLSSATTVAEVAAGYARETAALDVGQIALEARGRIEAAIRDRDLPGLLANYDNKGLLALAASHLKQSKLVDFEGWLTRVLRNDKAPPVAEAMRAALPRPVAA
jgi:ABC-type cobalamin/Fe3+-siderophores transport system ATPase subunit